MLFSDYKNLEEKKAKLKREFQKRKQLMQATRRPPEPNYQGPLDHADHMTNLKDEGWIGAMAVVILKELIMDVMTHRFYFEHSFAWDEALAEIVEIEFPHGLEFFCKSYVKNANGFFPPIYPVDPKTGDPDFDQRPLRKSQITDSDIISNGYHLRPGIGRGISVTLSNVKVRLQGDKVLSGDEFLHLFLRHKPSHHQQSEIEDTKADASVLRSRLPAKPAP